ncbi:hypothetical protein E4H12_13775 [Candidatus Thorarchaeota archaeon]|jgi:hypothetical protein|nr:hypothetical protein [Candidatus Thorarchaeota archaeon]TFG95192.1 MAG: hypothetical protein E4H12_13775 [Candidatus Thorarchaeota archaeon]
MISKLIGIALAATGFILLFYGMNDPSVMSYVYSFLGLLVMSMGFALLTAGRPKEEKTPPPTVTEIRCNDCDFKEIRDFKKGDYILKAVEEACPKCQTGMTIEGVYIIREEPKEKYNV